MRKAFCLCGAVQFDVEIPKPEIELCHCQQCQRWSGGGPLTAVRVSNVQIEGAENIATFHASEHGERAFCRLCGTTLYWTMRGKPPSFLSAGILEDQSGLRVTEEIFVDRRPDWLPHHADAKQSTEAEMQAQLQEYLERQP